MNLLLLGRGKTGSLVADVARERKHQVRTVGSADNLDCASLAPSQLRDIDLVIDFTAPHCVLAHIEASARAGKNMVVGTTGWYADLPRVKKMVEDAGTGFVYAANFSIGVNLFFDAARTAAAALRHKYIGQIFERHHVHKKDAPSGTALTLRSLIKDASGRELEITSFREGEVVGMHELVFESDSDRIYLCHDAYSRRGFAVGAVSAAEWLLGKKGFYDLKDIWRDL